jgi:ribosomal protein L29
MQTPPTVLRRSVAARRLRHGPACLFFCSLFLPGLLAAQTSPEIREILDRLQRLERQNEALAEEVHELRKELAESRGQNAQAEAPVKEKVDVQEARTEELAQSKVGSSQHFPIRITGMALFNAFRNSKGSGGQEYPLFAWPGSLASGGGSLRQTTIGLE